MNLLQLQQLADKGYGDGTMGCYYNHKTGKPKLYARSGGDTLAKFIAIELAETFEPDAPEGDQLAEAIRVMVRASEDLGNVIDVLVKRNTELFHKEQ
jgi:hypothetical protein